MLTVSVDLGVVESQLSAGVLACPCGGVLGPWGHARDRAVVGGGEVCRVRPRRGRCRSCEATHVLLPAALLLRRAHVVGVIGRAVELAVDGAAQRRIAGAVGVARSTVRGWLSRFAAAAEELRAHFLRWLLWLAPSQSRLDPAGGLVADAVAAVLAAAAAALDEAGISDAWQFASLATGGRLLANTSAPFPAPWTG